MVPGKPSQKARWNTWNLRNAEGWKQNETRLRNCLLVLLRRTVEIGDEVTVFICQQQTQLDAGVADLVRNLRSSSTLHVIAHANLYQPQTQITPGWAFQLALLVTIPVGYTSLQILQTILVVYLLGCLDDGFHGEDRPTQPGRRRLGAWTCRLRFEPASWIGPTGRAQDERPRIVGPTGWIFRCKAIFKKLLCIYTYVCTAYMHCIYSRDGS